MRTENEIIRPWEGETEPLVSVICATYNHEKFIRDAIDGFLEQITEFPFEILIHDDASTDATINIVREFAEKYPRIIRVIFQKENQYSKGHKIVPMVLPQTRGKYIALCEGDDYWNDRYKLQKQTDFLHANPSYATCIHNVTVLYEDSTIPHHPHFSEGFITGRHMYPKPNTFSTLDDLLRGNFIPTPSVMFRSGMFDKFPSWFHRCSMGDWPLHVLNSNYGGPIRYMDEIMGVYRVHDQGIWSSADKVENLLKSISSAECIKKELACNYSHTLEKTIIKWHIKIIKLVLIHRKFPFQKLLEYKFLFRPTFTRTLRLLRILMFVFSNCLRRSPLKSKSLCFSSI